MKKHFIQFGYEFKDAFIKALANTIAGAVLVMLGFGLAQTDVSKKFLNRVVNTFEKFTKKQTDIYEGLLQHLKEDHENDSLKIKKANAIKPITKK
ncbi:MAG: hypothetical protein HY063_00995 [Bacteroidetes bacterium]|nr:hypothetical protein [Bacteroidota bacterium]